MKPQRLARVLRQRPVPLAAAGQVAAICQALLREVRNNGHEVVETTGADTAHARRTCGIEKSHANDAACCGSSSIIAGLRRPTKLKAVGHGRRKQIKSLPKEPYRVWRHKKPAVRRATPCPGHARHPNHMHGIRSGDLVEIQTAKGRLRGVALVEASKKRVTAQSGKKSTSTSKASGMRKVAGRNGYRKSN